MPTSAITTRPAVMRAIERMWPKRRTGAVCQHQPIRAHPPLGPHIVTDLLVRRGIQNALTRFIPPFAVLALSMALVLISPLDPGRAQAAQDDPACSEADRPPAQASLHFMRSSVLCLVNRVRLQYGLRPL